MAARTALTSTDLDTDELVVAVRNGDLGKVVVSLSQNRADPNVQHAESGDTALHLAAKLGKAIITKTMIAFRANLSIKNKEGRTPLEEAKRSSADGAKECVKALEETTALIEEAKVNLSQAVDPTPLPPHSTVLLSLDGGGSRGLLLCQILIALHQRMKELEPDCAPLHEYFNYIAGTSAGALLLLSMVYCNDSPQASVANFFMATSELFAKCRPDCPQHIIDSYMIDTFKDRMLTEVKTPRVIITSCQAKLNPPKLELMCNYRPSLDTCRNWKTWEAARATSAAPIYFPPFEGKYIDGGLMANNPTLDAMAEIFHQAEREGKHAKFGMVLSIGTGNVGPSEVQNIGIHLPKSWKDLFTAISDIRSSLSGLHSMFTLFYTQSTQADGQEVHRAHYWCKSMGVPYYRFSPPLSEAVDLAEKDKEKLAELMYIGLHYTLCNAKELDTVARQLLSHRCTNRQGTCCVVS